jgi:hypothetical protein
MLSLGSHWILGDQCEDGYRALWIFTNRICIFIGAAYIYTELHPELSNQPQLIIGVIIIIIIIRSIYTRYCSDIRRRGGKL